MNVKNSLRHWSDTRNEWRTTSPIESCPLQWHWNLLLAAIIWFLPLVNSHKCDKYNITMVSLASIGTANWWYKSLSFVALSCQREHASHRAGKLLEYAFLNRRKMKNTHLLGGERLDHTLPKSTWHTLLDCAHSLPQISSEFFQKNVAVNGLLDSTVSTHSDTFCDPTWITAN